MPHRIRKMNREAQRRARRGLARALRGYCRLCGVCFIAIAAPAAPHELLASDDITNPFASRVLAFAPAPGQFVNDADFNNSSRALGPPSGGGTNLADNGSVVSLGGFGGFIVLGFDQPIEDHPLNRFGMDFIVFGNAFWIGNDPQSRWAEPAVVEVSRDANANGLPDDPWFLIPGSHLTSADEDRFTVTWDDDTTDDTYPPANEAWIPPGEFGAWSTNGLRLPSSLVDAVGRMRNPLAPSKAEGVWGYGDMSPTLVLGDLNGDNAVDDPAITSEEFYTVPDDPREVGVNPRSGGGDAFDIAWAVHPETGDPAALSSIDFVRISTAMHQDASSPLLNELSAEIDAVADARPDFFGDADADEDLDLFDVAEMLVCLGRADDSACEFLLEFGAEGIDGDTARRVIDRLTGPVQP